MSLDLRKLLGDFVACSPAMLGVLERVAWYARARTPLILVGATGTGKTTLAELIHRASGRAGPFTPRTASEFDPELERSQVFGHEAGAFTGAHRRHLGVFEEACDGTLLLDDFHHLRSSTQTLLLRVLERGAFRPLGGSRDLPARCRVIVGLTTSPDALVQEGRLLLELRFRLGFSAIELPRLEQRRDDIPALAQCFVERCPEQTGEPGPSRFTPEVLSLFQAAAWPGNVRQLEMVVRDAYLRGRHSEVIGLGHLPEVVHLAVRLALEVTRGGVDRAARLLHTSRTTVYHYMAAERGRMSERHVSGCPPQNRGFEDSAGVMA